MDRVTERSVRGDDVQVAALFADLSGFTKLTVDLARQGRRGSERVSEIVNASFQALIGAVTEYGGDLLTLSGDAVLAVWPVTDSRDLTLATRIAAECALACQRAVSALPAIEGRRLGVKVLLSSGKARLMEVGGLDGRWLFLAAGPALRDLSQIGDVPAAGEVAATARAWGHLQAVSTGEKRGDSWIVRQTDAVEHFAISPVSVGPEDIPVLRPWVPPTVLHRLDAGQHEWVAELRRVSVLFVNIPRISLDDPRQIASLNRSIVEIQTQLQRYEGAFQDLVQDDKGLILMASWGVPPFSHENDALRAVRAGLSMRETLNELKLEHTIGIATGQVFCGFYGNAVRRQHTVVGATVNLAARLMQAAQGGLLCDAETARRAGDRVRFVEQQPMQLKGFPEPIQPLRPLWAEQRTAPVPRSARGDTSGVVGRRSETQQLSGALAALVKSGTSAVVVIEGDAGIGKSMLVARLLGETRNLAVRALVGVGDDVERREPWFALRPIVEDLLDLQHVVDAAERREIV